MRFLIGLLLGFTVGLLAAAWTGERIQAHQVQPERDCRWTWTDDGHYKRICRHAD